MADPEELPPCPLCTLGKYKPRKGSKRPCPRCSGSVWMRHPYEHGEFIECKRCRGKGWVRNITTRDIEVFLASLTPVELAALHDRLEAPPK